MGDVGVFSLGGNKIITASHGGVLVSPRKELVEQVRFWSSQAKDPDPTGLRNYIHSELGYNYRFSNVLAAIALAQLGVLQQRIEERRAVAFRYRDAFAEMQGIRLMPQAAYGRHTNWLSCVLIDEKEFGMSSSELIRFLDTRNIESRPVWRPLHLQSLFERYECVGGSVAEDLHRRGVCLPSSSNLSRHEQEFILNCIREAHSLRKSKTTAVVLNEAEADHE